MTAKQRGRRVAAGKRKVRAIRRGGKRTARGRNNAMYPKEQRQLLRLVICSGFFVLLVAAKLLLPERMAQVGAGISAALERNMDVQAVFSAVGRAFSGEENMHHAANEVYKAVFQPDAEHEAIETAVQIRLEEDAAALNSLQKHRLSHENGLEEPAKIGDEISAVSTLEYILYSDGNLPDSVSMEQTILGFDYCTPVSGTISSDFGYRGHPVEGEDRFHYGLDLAADSGTEIVSFADGTVTAVGDSSSYGKYCIVRHQNGYSTLYAHCKRITASAGTSVKGGEKIAEVGETGMATGPHLHFELQRDGLYLNPIYYVAAV